MNDKIRKTAFRKRNYILPLMLLAVMLVLVFCVLFASSLDEQLYVQRLYSMEQNAKKSSELVNLSIRSEWEKLHQLKNIITLAKGSFPYFVIRRHE